MSIANEASVGYQSIFKDQSVRRAGGDRHRRRQRHRPLHRARAGSLGATVALVGRKPDKLETVAAEIAEDGGRRLRAACDIREEEAVAATVAGDPAPHGRIDGLVNNAGGQFPAPLADITQKGWEAVVRTNLTGGFLMARECYTQWMRDARRRDRQHRRRHVARHARHGPLGRGARGHGQLHADRGGRVGRSGVRVNAVAPGWIASSGFDTYPEPVKPWLRSLRRHTPLQRFGTEAEMSAAIVFLLSPAAAFISGARCASTAPRRTPSAMLSSSRTIAPSHGTASIAPWCRSCCRKTRLLPFEIDTRHHAGSSPTPAPHTLPLPLTGRG